NPALPASSYGLLAILLGCMTAAACGINDYWDVQKDQINHPERPLPSGRLSLQQAWWGAIGLFACALIAALPLGVFPTSLVALNILLLWNYSRLLQFNGILGNLLVATVIAMLIVLASWVAHRPFAMLYPTGFLFCYALAREIILDMHDAAGDRSQGVVTIANQWGVQTAGQVAWSLLAVLVISMPIAFLLVPMTHPLWFGSFALLLLFSLGIPFMVYQRKQSAADYEQLVFWERLGMIFGVTAVLGAAPLL
ncbi:MAG TPA: geranylgeranylglycerol-phosphate geranylgeranyltransferase, partial [Allocoleopsis sp.]